jgi:hypothetical protein
MIKVLLKQRNSTRKTMISLPTAVSDLFNLINSSDAEEVHHAFTWLRLLIEKHTQDRHNDPHYAELGMTDELAAIRLTDSQMSMIVDMLFAIVDQRQEKAIKAVWCLSKTFDDVVIHRLLAMLDDTWYKDDNLTAEIIKAAYDIKLLQNHWDLIERIAREGMPESKYVALQMLESRRKRASKSYPQADH